MNLFKLTLGTLFITSSLQAEPNNYARSAEAIKAIVDNDQVKSQIQSQDSAIEKIEAIENGYRVSFVGIGIGPNGMECWIDVQVTSTGNEAPMLSVGSTTCNK